jgi:hypothetical protein
MSFAIRHQTGAAFSAFPAAAWCIYGAPKLGKTTMASKWGRRVLTLNLLAEDNTTHITGDVADIDTPRDLAQAVKALRGGEYDAAVLDGISTLSAVEKSRHALDADGKEQDERRRVQEFWRDWQADLFEFMGLPIGRILVGHERTETLDRFGNKTLVTLDCPPVLRNYIFRKCQAVGYCWSAGRNVTKVNWQGVTEQDGKRTRTIEAMNSLGLPMVTDLGIKPVWLAMPKAQAVEQVDAATGEVLTNGQPPAE